MTWLLVAGGGAIGAMLRYGMVTMAQNLLGKDFPYGTLMVNVVGSLLIGVLYVVLVERNVLSDAWRLAFVVGVLGSFTTFSSFSLETLQLMQQSGAFAALLNVLSNVLLCLLFCWLGLAATRYLA